MYLIINNDQIFIFYLWFLSFVLVKRAALENLINNENWQYLVHMNRGKIINYTTENPVCPYRRLVDIV